VFLLFEPLTDFIVVISPEVSPDRDTYEGVVPKVYLELSVVIDIVVFFNWVGTDQTGQDKTTVYSQHEYEK